ATILTGASLPTHRGAIMGEDHLANRAELEMLPWTPSPSLRQTLGVGIGATLTAALLLLVQSALTMAEAHSALTHIAGWLALVPGIWVLAAYVRLGEETRYRSLITSSIGVFVALILLQLYDLIALELLPWYGQAALLVVLGLSLIVLAIWPFM